jgi:rhodanese-related sulfurtransferase
MRNVTLIGEYQLKNVLKHPLNFHFFDLRSESERNLQAAPKSFEKSLQLSSAQVLKCLQEGLVNARKIEKSEPIILICQDGQESLKLAAQVDQIGYINIFVIEGGFNSMEIKA